MKTFSITMISMVAMTGLALAQGAGAKVDAKAGAGAGSAAAGAGAKAGATAGSAANATGGAAKAGAGAATGAAGTATATAPVKMEMPKAPPEIAATLKMMGARKTCTGTGLGPDMKTEAKFKGVTTAKLELDNWWIHGSLNGTMGEGKTSGKFKMESWMTWDAKLNKWRTFGFSNDGGSMVGTAEMKDGKWSGNATMTSAMGEAMFRESGEQAADKKSMHMWGEMSMDKGKTWVKLFDMTCK